MPEPFTKSMMASRSSSVTKAPWTRVGLRPMGAKSISPFPTRLSAPCWSRMMRLSSELATDRAMRLGILAFMRPVITSARGLWVATTRCMPAARPIWATRQMDSSTSLAAIIMRSASSSMKMTTWGSVRAPSRWSTALYPARSRTPVSENSRYRRSISMTAHCSAPAAFLGSVTTGTYRWGISLYTTNSTILGSIMIMRTSWGDALYSRLRIMELTHTDLPEPVVPAMSTWGIFAILPTMTLPAMSLPMATLSRDFEARKTSESIRSPSQTVVLSRLGTSTPTVEILSGMGAMRTLSTPRERAMSLPRFSILDSFTPWSRRSSYRVMEGPRTAPVMVAPTP